MSTQIQNELLSLDYIYQGQPFVEVPLDNVELGGLDVAYQGSPFFVSSPSPLDYYDIFVKVNGGWKQVYEIYFRINGSWKTVNDVQMKSTGTWKAI
jgi:hypothetical protein